MTAAVAAEYDAVAAEAAAVRAADPATRRRAAARLRRELHRIQGRDFFTCPQRDAARRAVEAPGRGRHGRGADVKWATRPGVHVDRAACAWLIRRFIDPDPEFIFAADLADVPAGATPFDMRGAALGHHQGRCTFETVLASFDLADDPALEEIGHIVHEADLADDRYDAPAAPGLDVLIRGLTLTSGSDHDTLAITDQLFDGLYEHTRRQLMTGRPPA